MNCTNENCPAYAKCLASYRGSTCKATRATYGLGDPMTNADRIRGMTDEELAHLLHTAEEHIFSGNLWNYEQWRKWLKAPVEVQE